MMLEITGFNCYSQFSAIICTKKASKNTLTMVCFKMSHLLKTSLLEFTN